MNLRSWLEAQSGSISPADNIRSRLAGTARSAKRTSCEATRAREASSCEATSLRSRQGRAAQSVAPQPVQAVDCGRIVSSGVTLQCTHPTRAGSRPIRDVRYECWRVLSFSDLSDNPGSLGITTLTFSSNSGPSGLAWRRHPGHSALGVSMRSDLS